MSKQLAVSAAFSVFALAALALFAPESHRIAPSETGAAIAIAAPAPFIDQPGNPAPAEAVFN